MDNKTLNELSQTNRLSQATTTINFDIDNYIRELIQKLLFYIVHRNRMDTNEIYTQVLVNALETITDKFVEELIKQKRK